MPTDTDVKLAEDIRKMADSLASLRVEVAQRFGTLSTDIEARFGAVNTRLEGIQVELRAIQWVGAFFAGILITLVAGAIGVAWNASALNSEVKQMAKQIDVLIRRSEPGRS
jgi:hypothetical protein